MERHSSLQKSQNKSMETPIQQSEVGTVSVVPNIGSLLTAKPDVQRQMMTPEVVSQLSGIIGNHELQRMLSGSLPDAPIQRAPSKEAITVRAEQIRKTRGDKKKPSKAKRKKDYKTAKAQLVMIEKVKKSKGYKELDKSEQDRLMALLEGTNEELSLPAHRSIKQMIDGGTLDITKKADYTKFLNTQPWLPGVVDPKAGTFKGKARGYKLSSPTSVGEFEFTTGVKALAKKYVLTIGKKTVDIYYPKKPDKKQGKFHSVSQIAKGLATLPPVELKAVKEVRVHPKPNPDDAHWQTVFGDPNFSSYMTAGASGVIDVYPSKSKMTQDYLSGTMIHEAGHILSQKKWGKNAATDPGWAPWRDAMQKDGFAASKYATENADEDFAEALQLYETVKGKPQAAEIKKLMPRRWKLIKKLLGS